MVDIESRKVRCLKCFKQCASKHLISEDRISQLPTEILHCILSLLTFKEAGRTSVLSKRWKNVWTTVPELDFNATTTFCEMATTCNEYVKRLPRERAKFANWVNKVLDSHDTLELIKFTIKCDLDSGYQVDIDKWLQYAFDRKVQRLELNLHQRGPASFYDPDLYAFPSASVAHRSFNSLKELILKNVRVSGDTIVFLLHNCKFLESLVVHKSALLESIEVFGPSLALQHLEIVECPLFTLIVRNCNLNTLSFGGPLEKLVLENVPRLVHIRIACGFIVEDVFNRLSCCFSKLEVLFLSLNCDHSREYEGKLPQLYALKQLFIELMIMEEEGMCGLATLCGASPNLEKFVINMNYAPQKDIQIPRVAENVVNYRVQHLRVVEITGYRGRSIELDIVKYFLENAVSLEQIIVDPHFLFEMQVGEPYFNDEGFRHLEAEITSDSRRRATQQLLGMMPSRVTLQIL